MHGGKEDDVDKTPFSSISAALSQIFYCVYTKKKKVEGKEDLREEGLWMHWRKHNGGGVIEYADDKVK